MKVKATALVSKRIRAAQAVAGGLTHAEAAALVGRSARTVTRWLQDPQLRALAERDGAAAGELGPREVLQGALAASKANGQPDWPTRLSAARTLAALAAEQPEPQDDDEPAVSIVVYDLPPGTEPVLVQRRPAAGAAEPRSEAEPPPPHPLHDHLFSYHPRDGESVVIGSWAPARVNESANAVVKVQFCTTSERETAELWRAELAAGRLPQSSDNPDCDRSKHRLYPRQLSALSPMRLHRLDAQRERGFGNPRVLSSRPHASPTPTSARCGERPVAAPPRPRSN
jgi:hypothetical protein